MKRFSSVQDFLGAKIFAPLLDVSGINFGKMSEVLYAIEKEEIIDSLDNWIELREIRSELEHDYPMCPVSLDQNIKAGLDLKIDIVPYNSRDDLLRDEIHKSAVKIN